MPRRRNDPVAFVWRCLGAFFTASSHWKKNKKKISDCYTTVITMVLRASVFSNDGTSLGGRERPTRRSTRRPSEDDRTYKVWRTRRWNGSRLWVTGFEGVLRQGTQISRIITILSVSLCTRRREHFKKHKHDFQKVIIEAVMKKQCNSY